MKIEYLIMILFLQIHHLNLSISFFEKNNPGFNKINLFWYLKFFQQTKSPFLTGKNTTVAILDGNIYQNNPNCNIFLQNEPNLTIGERLNCPSLNTTKEQKDSSWLMEKTDFSSKFFQKNHGNCTISIIKQIAPESIIISIPVLDNKGYADKEGVYQALKLVKRYNPDILHLGFQILDFDLNQKLDKKIYRLLKKFTFVVVPIGNNMKSDFPPKSPNIFSVASFSKKGNNYPISEFCQNISQADFIMPGENIGVTIKNIKDQVDRTLSVSGTSFSTAFMTGFVALLFEKNNKNITQTIANILKSATFLENDWQNKIRYGFPHF